MTKTIKNFYKQSLSFKAADKVSSFIMKIIFSSFIYKILFHDLNSYKFFSQSFCRRIIDFFIKLILLPRRFLSAVFKDSFINNLLDKIFTPYLPQAFLDSSIAKFISDYFGINFKRSDKKSGLIFAISLLVIAAFFSFFIGPVKSFIIIFVLYFSLLVLYNTKVGLLVLAFFLPLVKTKFILALTILSILSFIFKLLFTNEYNLSVNLIDLFIILFASLIFFSIFISYIPMDSAKMASVYLLFIGLYFTAKNVLTQRNDLFAVVSTMIFSSAIVAIIGIAQKYFGLAIETQMWIDQEMFANNTMRVYSTLDNPNVLGEYLVLMIPIIFGSIYYLKNKLAKVVSFFILGLTCVCMLLTLSRGAWLGLIAAMLIFIAFRDKKFLLVGFIFILFLPMLIPQSFIERFMSIGNMADSSTSYRVGIWIGSLRMIKDFWPIGIGMGTNVFIYIFQKYALSASYALHSHNFYLQLIIDLGITGFIIMMTIIAFFYKNLFVNNRFLTDNFLKTFKISLCAGFTGYMIQGLTDNIWYNYRIALMFWLMIAISTACLNLSKLRVWEKFKFFQHTTKFN